MPKGKPGPKGPSKYDPKFCQEIVEFFNIEPFITREIVTTGKNDYCKTETVEVANPLPHLIDFARKIDVHIDTLNAWSKQYPEFSDALKAAKAINERMLATNALKGLYNASFSIFMAKNKFGWRDEQYLKAKTETKDEKTVTYKLDGLTADDLRALIQAGRNKTDQLGASRASEVRSALDQNEVG